MNAFLRVVARGRFTSVVRTASEFRFFAVLATAGLALSLQACGGGGGGGGGGNNKPQQQVTPPSALSYSSPQNYQVGTPITPLTPSVTGTVTSYKVSPALPAGLSLDAASGEITGTPSAPRGSRAYTITASNAGGSADFALTLEVLLERATADRADETSERQVHVMYVLPSDAADDRLDRLGTLEGSVRSWNNWFAGQTGGKKIRLDTYAGGRLDVTFLRLARTDAEMSVAGGNVRDKLEYQLLANGFDSTDKVYLVYYGGTGDACGRGPWPPTQPGNVAAFYILSTASGGCSSQSFAAETDPPRYPEYLGIHEVLHLLGFAAPCAPHVGTSGHVSDDPTDLMYSGTQAWVPSTLDVNHDDYYGAANPGCPDLANSAFLDPLPAGPELPPGWPYYNLADEGCANELTITPGPNGADTQVMFVNDHLVGGSPASVAIHELLLDTGTGQNVRSLRATVPYLEGVVVPAKENATFVATANGQCVAVVRAAAGAGRFVVR